jgi:hypothetical protein
MTKTALGGIITSNRFNNKEIGVTIERANLGNTETGLC